MSKKRSAATRRAEASAAQVRATEVRAEQERKERRRRSIVVTAVGIGVLALVLVIGYVIQSARDTSGDSAAAPAGAVGGVAVPAGSADAPVEVVVYEDFLCPFCGDFEAASREEFADDVEAGKVRFLYQPLAFLDRLSNGTDYSTRAANALGVVLDASGPETAARFHDLLFENQPEEGTDGLDDGALVDLAVQAGATEADVRPGIEDRTFEQWVKNVRDSASKDGVTSTPTVEIDGERVEFESIDELVEAIRTEVDAAG